MEHEEVFKIEEERVSLPSLPDRDQVITSLEHMYVFTSNLEDQLDAQRKQERNTMMSIFKEMLEIIDSLDRISEKLGKIKELSNNEERIKGNIESTRRLALQKLKKNGVIPMDLLGSVLNPHLAEVEDYEIRPDLEEETVIEELVKGYSWNNEVLRPGRVVVSKQA